LCQEDLIAADAGQPEQAKQAFFVITIALGPSPVPQRCCPSDVRTKLPSQAGGAVLDIVEIEHGLAVVDPATDCRDLL
jgi:hypothetical protein